MTCPTDTDQSIPPVLASFLGTGLLFRTARSVISHLRGFGARCFARIPSHKNGAHFQEAVSLGYPDGTKGWRLRDVCTGPFFNSRDVIFDEGSILEPRDEGDVDTTRLAN